jgi:hypothetical protein
MSLAYHLSVDCSQGIAIVEEEASPRLGVAIALLQTQRLLPIFWRN